MGKGLQTTDKTVLGLYWVARGLLVIWAVSWLIFYAKTLMDAMKPAGFNLSHINIIFMLIVILVVFAVAWRFLLAGGIMLILYGGLIFAERGVDSATQFFTLIFPMIVIGLLFIATWMRAKTAREAEAKEKETASSE